MQQAVRQGKWIYRPKTDYDLIDGELVPNAKVPIVRGSSPCEPRAAWATGRVPTPGSVAHCQSQEASRALR